MWDYFHTWEGLGGHYLPEWNPSLSVSLPGTDPLWGFISTSESASQLGNMFYHLGVGFQCELWVNQAGNVSKCKCVLLFTLKKNLPSGTCAHWAERQRVVKEEIIPSLDGHVAIPYPPFFSWDFGHTCTQIWCDFQAAGSRACTSVSHVWF